MSRSQLCASVLFVPTFMRSRLYQVKIETQHMYHFNFSCYATAGEVRPGGLGERSDRPIATMKTFLVATALLCLVEASAMTDNTASFEADRVGAAPKGWTATKTGKGDPKWTVERDETAPSKQKVLKQSGRATYPLLLKNDTNIKDGFIEVKFKAIAGSQDRAGGVVWR